jgi:hypothetical protein
MSNKIKVAGYSKKLVFTDGIEYINFSPDLVGLQLTSNGGTPLFTMGNFNITTNIDPKIDKFYNTAKFSEFFTLSDLDLNLNETLTLLTDNAGVYLNLDKTKLDYYALFGSLSEYIRVALEEIILNWPASLYMTPLSQTTNGETINGYTVENYSYDSLTEIASFKVNTNFINNKFGLTYSTIGNIENTFNTNNTLRNLTISYKSYSVLYNNTEYPLVDYTASTNNLNDYIYLKVKGNPFSGSSINQYVYYHVKPNKLKEEQFFNTLPDFQAYLLNRQITPQYTATFKYPTKSEMGVVLYISETLTWPVSDGYNIDFDTTQYVDYATRLFDLSNSNDLFSSNLMNRFLVSESITSFDTVPVNISGNENDETGQKINKTLQIYGVGFDEINRYITGIQFSNVVTYDKEDNTPDLYLKNLARVLGWELVSSVLENDLLASYVTSKPSTYSGLTVGLTPIEADVELWRRLILNSPWLWKSKGARKSIEFLLKFIGAPKGLVTFNEHIYKADAPIDVNLFQQILDLNGITDDISTFPIDSEGYPKPLPDTDAMYFQNNGLWYRETGGSGSTIDILGGNNPHLGPYDKGYKYIKQFEHLITNFSAVTVSSITTTTDTVNLYTNYDLGTFDEGVSTATTVDTVVTNQNDLDLTGCVVFEAKIEIDPNPTQVLNDCGCEVDTPDNVLSLCLQNNPNYVPPSCDSENVVSVGQTTATGILISSYYIYQPDGSLYYFDAGIPHTLKTNYISKECCTAYGGTSFLNNEYENGVLVNSGYYCCYAGGQCGCKLTCDWLAQLTPINISGQNYIQFTTPNGQSRVVTADGCNCLADYSIAVPNITDPYTGEIGYACQLTGLGNADMLAGTPGEIFEHYKDKVGGIIPCV